MDGKGGPSGLGGEEIPLLSRILAVADAADRIIEVQESGVALHDAVDTLARQADRFDPAVVAALGQALGRRERDVLQTIPSQGAQS